MLNGVTRPVFGWVSDRIGRETTMFIAFLAEGVGILLLARLGQDPLLFVLLTGVVFFAWGEIYSLFPATCGDVFGSRYAAALNIIAALMAILVLKPVRRRQAQRQENAA